MRVDELEYFKSLCSKFQVLCISGFLLFKSVLLKLKVKDIKLLLVTLNLHSFTVGDFNQK